MRVPGLFSPTHRWRALGVGAVLLIAGRVVVAICGLVQVPIALAHLGTERFGVWVALTGLLWTVSGFDGGIGFALQNRLARQIAQGKQQDAAALARRGLRRLYVVGLAVAVGGGALAVWGEWANWFGISDPGLAAEMPSAVGVAFAAAAISVPLSLATRVAAARQQTWLTGFWSAIAGVAGLIAVSAAAFFHGGLFSFMAAACVLPVAPHAATWFHLRRTGVWLGARAEPDPSDAGLWSESAAFFVPQLGAAFNSSLVPTLMAFFAGPAAAATYGVLQRVFGLVLQLQSLSLQPTWPAYTHAAARGDALAARRIFNASMIGAVACGVATLLVLAPFMSDILRLWLGVMVPDFPLTLLWSVAGWHVVQGLGQPPALLLNGTGHASLVAITGIAGIVGSLGLSLWLGPSWGAVGVVAALAIPYVVLNLPLVTWQAIRVLGHMGELTGAAPS